MARVFVTGSSDGLGSRLTLWRRPSTVFTSFAEDIVVGDLSSIAHERRCVDDGIENAEPGRRPSEPMKLQLKITGACSTTLCPCLHEVHRPSGLWRG
jgi:hypothetical protein